MCLESLARRAVGTCCLEGLGLIIRNRIDNWRGSKTKRYPFQMVVLNFDTTRCRN